MRHWLLVMTLFGTALAGPPEDWSEVPLEPEPENADGQGDDDEVVVWGTAATGAAHSAVLRTFKEQGWTVRRRLADGSVVMSGPSGWMGSARFSPVGLVTFRRRWVSFSPVREVANTPTDGLEALNGRRRDDAGVSTQGGLQGPTGTRKLDKMRERLLYQVEPEVRQYRRVLSETALQQTLAVLPERLDALWLSGQPLAVGPTLATPAARRQAVLDYWVTRPKTREGRLTLRTIEDWIGEVMQSSPTPATAKELSEAAAKRGDGRHPTGGTTP
ncbi:MAG: hypothetical protein AB8H79_25870 [Myxococcota bacterium]